MASDKLIKEVAANLKKLRLDNAKGQTEVAKALGISVAALSKIENGLTDLNLSRLAQMAAYFQVSLIAILCKAPANSAIAQNVVAEIELLNKQLVEKDAEINKLQKKVIVLYEKLEL